MSERYIFHLAFPVSDLAESKRFYVGLLGAGIGRESPQWLDILLWGHQLTLHQSPDEVLSKEDQGKRHFGVVLPWSEWETLAEHLRSKRAVFLREPEILLAGTPQEQAKLYLEDPSNNVIEIKAYRNLAITLKQENMAYSYEQA